MENTPTPGKKRQRSSTMDNFVVNKKVIDKDTQDHLQREKSVAAEIAINHQPCIVDVSATKNDNPVRPILDTYPMNEKNRRFSQFYFTKHDWIEYFNPK